MKIQEFAISELDPKCPCDVCLWNSSTFKKGDWCFCVYDLIQPSFRAPVSSRWLRNKNASPKVKETINHRTRDGEISAMGGNGAADRPWGPPDRLTVRSWDLPYHTASPLSRPGISLVTPLLNTSVPWSKGWLLISNSNSCPSPGAQFVLSLSFSLSLALSLSDSGSLSGLLSLSLSLSVSLSLYRSPSVSGLLSMSLSLSVSLSLYRSPSVSLFLSLSLALFISRTSSRSLYLCLCLFLCASVSLSLSLALSLSVLCPFTYSLLSPFLLLWLPPFLPVPFISLFWPSLRFILSLSSVVWLLHKCIRNSYKVQTIQTPLCVVAVILEY